jgi:hypothetical protein
VTAPVHPIGPGSKLGEINAWHWIRVFNLHAASVTGAEDQPARERLLRYVLRPRFAARQ